MFLVYIQYVSFTFLPQWGCADKLFKPYLINLHQLTYLIIQVTNKINLIVDKYGKNLFPKNTNYSVLLQIYTSKIGSSTDFEK